MSQSTPTTVSERLFAEYLDAHGHDWVFEPSIVGKEKRPDFLVKWNGADVLCEVKGRQGRELEPPMTHYDPMRGIRKKVEKARGKFKEFGEYCCALVIYNAGDPNTRLTPIDIFGAMLGNPEFTMEMRNGVGQLDTARSVFGPHGGKMVCYKTGEYQNRTISAILVLEEVKLRNHEFDRAVDAEIEREASRQGRALGGSERGRVCDSMFFKLRPTFQHPPRILVCEHPEPRVAFPPDIFTGPYDERYAAVNNSVDLLRIFAGDRVSEIEEPEQGTPFVNGGSEDTDCI